MIKVEINARGGDGDGGGGDADDNDDVENAEIYFLSYITESCRTFIDKKYG